MAENALVSSSSLPLLFRSSASSPRRLGSFSSLRFRPNFAASFRSLSFAPNPRRRSCSAASASMSVEAPPASSPDLEGPDGSSRVPVLLFAKYQGLGNDFIMVDNRELAEPALTEEQAVKMCDRNFGIGADGVIFVLPGVDGTDYSMRIFNSDGSEPEMCGNGIRCFARFVAELERTHDKRSFKIHTGAGLIIPEIQDDEKVKVDMGEPILRAADIPTKLPPNKNDAVIQAGLFVDDREWNVTCVSMGNPHCVTFGTNSTEVDDLKLDDIGPKFEHHEMFPSRTNTGRWDVILGKLDLDVIALEKEFVQVLSRSHLKMRVWERGAGATLACGTGACAVVVAAVLEGRTERKCVVDLPGGPLEIEWREEDNHIYMTGPAKGVFYGCYSF